MKTNPLKTSISDQGQISFDAAKVYEEFFVPALFREWAPRVAHAAHIKPGDHVLDVACGTGVLARYIEEKVKPGGQVTGIDINDGMLFIASEAAPGIKWDKGFAETLPYENNFFDAVVSQFGMMFFNDPGKSIKEMMRVLKPKKYLAVAVWDKLENLPGYAELVRLLEQQFGRQIADKLRAPFGLGNRHELFDLYQNAGIISPQITTVKGVARFPSVRSWIYTDVRGWVFSELVNDTQLDKLVALAEKEFDRFITDDGKVQFDVSAHIIVSKKE
jgi:ubiquinone/menaquinone biosynthesis C-methylase UbiE